MITVDREHRFIYEWFLYEEFQCWNVYVFSITELNLVCITKGLHQSEFLHTFLLANGRQLPHYWEETSFYSSFSEIFSV